MSKKRSKCPRLCLLNDEDLLQVLCCGSNLESLSENIGRVFNQIKSIKFDTTTNEKFITGCFGRNEEYFSLKNVNHIPFIVTSVEYPLKIFINIQSQLCLEEA